MEYLQILLKNFGFRISKQKNQLGTLSSIFENKSKLKI